MFQLTELMKQSLVLLAYVIFAQLPLNHYVDVHGISPVSPASGLALAMLILGGNRYLPAIFIGSLLTRLFQNPSIAAALLIATGSSLEAWLAQHILSNSRRFNAAFDEFRHFLFFLVIAALTACLASLAGCAGLLLNDTLAPTDLYPALMTWWQGDALGQIIVTPLILTWRNGPAARFSKVRGLESIAFLGSLVFVSLVVFLDAYHQSLGFFARGYWLFLFASWAAIRFGIRGSTLLVFVTASLALAGEAINAGFFAFDFEQAHLFNFTAYIIGLSCVGMAIATSLQQARIVTDSLAQTENQYRYVLSKFPLPFAFNDDQQNISYLNQAFTDAYGYIQTDIPTLQEWWPSAYPDPAYRQAVIDQWLDHLELAKATGKQFKPFEVDIRCKDGRLKTALITAFPLANSSLGTSLVSLLDISTRKAIENQLAASEAHLRLCQEAGGICTWEADLLTHKQKWSDITALGLAHIDQPTWEDFINLVHPDDRLKVIDCFNRHIEHDEKYDVEYRCQFPDGSLRWFRSSGQVERDTQGQPIVMRGIAQDIDDRKQAEIALKTSERELRLLAEAMPQIVWITRADGWNIFFNHQWVDYTGLSLEQSYGHGWNIPFHPEDQQDAWDAWQKAIHQQAVYSLECRLRRHDGEYRWWLIRGEPVLENGGISKWFGTCTDIHDIKLTEVALKLSEQRYRQLFEANPIPMWICDLETMRFLDVNNAALANYRYSRDVFLALTLTDIQPRNDSSALFVGLHQKNPVSDHYTKTGMWRHRRRDGSEFWADILRQTLTYQGRKVQVIMARDVSQQIEIQQSLQESEARWKFALEGSNQGVWDWNIATNKVYFSPRWKSMLGYAEPDIADTVDEFFNRIHSDDLQHVNDTLGQYLRGEIDIYQNEHRIRNRSGEYQWILTRGMVVERDATGLPLRMIGTHQDTTERHAILSKLMYSESLTRSIMDSLSSAIAVLDEQGNILHSNQAWQRFAEDHLTMASLSSPPNYFDICQGASNFPACQEIMDGMTAVLNGQQPRYLKEYSTSSAKGQSWFRLEVLPLKSSLSGLVTHHIDISERKSIEDSLRESQRLLVDSQKIAHIGSWALDMQSGQISWSDETFRLLGLSAENHQAPSGDAFLCLLHPEDRPAIQTWWNACLAENNPPGIEIRTCPVDGAYRWLLVYGQLERSEQGHVLRMVGTVQDITTRKKAKVEIEKHKANLEAALTSMSDAVFICDLDGQFIHINEAFASFHKFHNQTECPGNCRQYPDLFEIFDDHGQLLAFEQWPASRALRGEAETAIEYTLRRKDTAETWVGSYSFAPILDSSGSIAGAVITARDISKNKAIEEAMRLQSTALEAAANAIMITDPNGMIEWVNPAFTAMTGFENRDAIGNNPRVLIKSGMHENSLYDDLWRTVTSGRVWHGEVVNLRKDGSHYIEEQFITPVLNDQGEIQHFIAIKQDITERKKQEAELLDYRDHLENLVKDRTQELTNAREQAERLSNVKSDFVANMSHEIRTPMNAVLGFCYLLEQQPLNDEAAKLVQKIYASGRSLLAIINDVLDFSKIEAGHLDITREPFLLSNLLDHLSALMLGSVGDKNLELIIVPPSQVNALIGDEMRLQQVLVNLLSNAIKFTSQGEVSLRISVSEKRDDQLVLRFSVHDTGIGISLEQQLEVFSAFTQADTTISRRFGGSGLGLAISQKLVRLMGGELKVDSQLGAGCEFWFELPLQADPSAPASKFALTNLHLLVVDDSYSAREAICLTAEYLGWQPEAVESGQQAIAQALARFENHTPYDVLLLDWKMPAMDGLATAQALRGSPIEAVKSPIVLMITAHAMEELEKQPGIVHIDGILSKPVTPSSLYNAVDKVLRDRQSPTPPTVTRAKSRPGPSLSGVRVLVVDDSLINRDLASTILQAEGATVSLAGNGQEALDWLSTHPGAIDIVLMDIQMPVMDGYTATRHIRQNPHWVDLPIIALTAGAFKNHQDAALEAGLSDFITKPFNVQALLTSIQRWTAGKTDQAMLASPAKPQAATVAEMSTPPDALPGIDIKLGLETWKNVNIYQEYLARFVDEYADADQKITTACDQGDMRYVAALAHKMKGAAAVLALPIVTAICKDMQNTETLPPPEITRALQQAIDEVAHSLANWQATENHQRLASLSGEHDEDTKAVLTQLLAALNEDNPGSVKPYLNALEKLLSPAAINPIKRHIQDYNFREAEVLTRSLLDHYTENFKP